MAPIASLNLTLAGYNGLNQLKAGMYCLSGNNPADNILGNLNIYPECYGICPNSNVAGFGVRTSFYAQTVLGLLLGTICKDPNAKYASMFIAITTSLCLLIAAIYSLSQDELTLHHSLIAINLATLPTMTFFAAIFRMRIANARSTPSDSTQAKGDDTEKKSEEPSSSQAVTTPPQGNAGTASSAAQAGADADGEKSPEPTGSPAATPSQEKTSVLEKPTQGQPENTTTHVLKKPRPSEGPVDGPKKPSRWLAFVVLLFHVLCCAILLGFGLGLANASYVEKLGTSTIVKGLRKIQAAQPQCNHETNIVIFFRTWPLLRTESFGQFQQSSRGERIFVHILYVALLFAPFVASIFMLFFPAQFLARIVGKLGGGWRGFFLNTLTIVLMLTWVAIIVAMTEMQIAKNFVLPGEQTLDFGQLLPILLILIPLFQLLSIVFETASAKYFAVYQWVERRGVYRWLGFPLPEQPEPTSKTSKSQNQPASKPPKPEPKRESTALSVMTVVGESSRTASSPPQDALKSDTRSLEGNVTPADPIRHSL